MLRLSLNKCPPVASHRSVMPTLDNLSPGQHATIVQLAGDDATARRLMELGLLPGEAIELIGRAPLGDPLAILVKGGRLAVRARDARRVEIAVTATP